MMLNYQSKRAGSTMARGFLFIAVLLVALVGCSQTWS